MLRQPWTETITAPAPVDKRENPDPPGSAVSVALRRARLRTSAATTAKPLRSV